MAVDRQSDNDAALSLAMAPEGRLPELVALAREAGATDLATEAQVLAERVREGRFHVAVVGQFKRGKSTLINALVGDSVLPSGVVPVTSIVTVVGHGPRRGARVQLGDGAWRNIEPTELAAFVSEDGNPDNTKCVAGVEVFVPSPLLASGMCLVDTPGLGSVFTGGSAATHAFVPHVDAALVVLGADPPISESELALVEQVSRHVTSLVVVLNKADRVSDAERRQAKTFSERVLTERVGVRVGTILEVSAAERLAEGEPTRQWASLVAALERLARESGAALVRGAKERGLQRLADRLLRVLGEERDALARPVEHSERRIETLVACAADAERAMHDLGHLFNAEQERLARTFAAQRVQFLERTLSACRHELGEELRNLNGRGPALRQRAILLAQDIAGRWLDRWRAEEQPAAEAGYRRAAERFVGLANQFLDRLANSGEPALATLPRSVGVEVDFRVRSRLHYTELWRAAGGSPVRWLADRLLSRESLLRRLDQDAGDYLEALLYTNGTRIENDFNDRVLESRRLLESEIRGHLGDVHASAERALARARARISEGSEAVKAELGRIDTLRRQVFGLLERNSKGEAL
jgi:GTP-binding protein EngB required for normal cell division